MTDTALSQHEREHTPAAIRARLASGPTHSYLRDFVYGAIDGTVTTFAIVAGVEGAALSAKVVCILGLVNLLADGFSMAASNFLATRTEQLQLEKARHTEREHIARFPEGEREEIRQLFAQKGFRGEVLEQIVEVITADEERWVQTMLTEELGLRLVSPSPWRAASMTFLAFVLVGLVPLASYLAASIWPAWQTYAFSTSCLLTAGTFFTVGALKSLFLQEPWYRTGAVTLGVGGIAAVVAYCVGYLLKHILPVT
ncbi:MAG: VIT1/CCC1 transporter family protein [Gemmatales bacterium]|nr:VIT1/CCC1 transporter family protein [Gemmatales bacterium]MCS7161520.1 VIT1/CCC1 transporter family protein [Gemmatales bacterium]MDW8176723.1 VIT1/CCC1 transporter family protein [Gemmatales bacterium]MDW8223161.1 VIT1/CCC1 transporter family protein [Gemmatales bacterium]